MDTQTQTHTRARTHTDTLCAAHLVHGACSHTNALAVERRSCLREGRGLLRGAGAGAHTPELERD